MNHEWPVLTRAQVRQLDRIAIEQFGLPGVVLMENAGRALASAILEELRDAERVLVLCGAGNNGGDGYVLARYLVEAGVTVTLLETAPPQKLAPDARVFRKVCAAMQIPALLATDVETLSAHLNSLEPQQLVIDALLGTGFSGALREPQRSQLERLGQAISVWGSRVIAVGTPSGLDVDSGEAASETLAACLTLTLAANKPAFAGQACGDICGRVRVLSIGLPWAVYERVL